ncbi:hypothetical protein BBSC_0724 [Bifidobacterium scardovii JCM 12489 = DSM 13734]|nr:hypothetical protein BBSC_0724 [Bifidobacterium scardovii JCM 12489 = DSM 13734]
MSRLRAQHEPPCVVPLSVHGIEEPAGKSPFPVNYNVTITVVYRPAHRQLKGSAHCDPDSAPSRREVTSPYRFRPVFHAMRTPSNQRR